MEEGELKVILLIAAGGALGSVLRYLLSGWLTRGDFPWGTAVVNIAGSFALGALFFMAMAQGSLSPEWRAFCFIGVLGGFTTMSTFSLETISMLEKGEALAAAGNIFLNVVLCLGGTFLGRAVGLWAGG